MVTIWEAYKAYKEGKKVRVSSVENCRMTREAARWYGQIIPEGVNFRIWTDNYQFWTNTHPQFEIVE